MAAPPDPPPARHSHTRPAVQPRAAKIPAAGAVADAVVNPFPGLRPFREDEEHLFFGRESQIDRMADKLAHRRFLAVVGTSGSGKSSLVNCGLRPALHRGLVTRAGTAEIDFERRWLQRFLVPGGLVLLVFILVTARVVQDRDLVAALIPAALGPARTVLTFVIELAVAATPFVLVGLGLAHWGRQWYRRWAFPGLLRRQAAAAGGRSPAGAMASATATEEEAIAPAPEALRTGYAPFARRAVGRLVDMGVSLLVLIGVGVSWGVAHTLMYGAEAPVSDAAALAMFGTWVVVDWLYQALTTSSKRSATLGMMAVGIIVPDTQGKRLSFLRATARSWARLLSYYSGMIGFLMQPFTARKQTLHDLITRSVVLVDPARIAGSAPQVAPVA